MKKSQAQMFLNNVDTACKSPNPCIIAAPKPGRPDSLTMPICTTSEPAALRESNYPAVADVTRPEDLASS